MRGKKRGTRHRVGIPIQVGSSKSQPGRSTHGRDRPLRRNTCRSPESPLLLHQLCRIKQMCPLCLPLKSGHLPGRGSRHPRFCSKLARQLGYQGKTRRHEEGGGAQERSCFFWGRGPRAPRCPLTYTRKRAKPLQLGLAPNPKSSPAYLEGPGIHKSGPPYCKSMQITKHAQSHTVNPDDPSSVTAVLRQSLANPRLPGHPRLDVARRFPSWGHSGRVMRHSTLFFLTHACFLGAGAAPC